MRYIKEIINHRIGDSTESEAVAASMGWTITRNDEDLETAWDGSIWEKGFAPERPEPTYDTKRAAEYPSITDQLDMIYWDNIRGTNTWRDTITEIKNKYPKN